MTEEKQTTSSAITLHNPLPRVLVALNDDVVAKVHATVGALLSQRDTDPKTWPKDVYDTVASAYREAQELEKAITEGKKELTGPIVQLQRRLTELVDSAVNPLREARVAIGKHIVIWEAEEAERQRQAYEAERAEYEAILAEYRAAEEAARAAAAKAAAERAAAAAATGEVDPYFSELFDGSPANDNAVPVVDLAHLLPPPPEKPVAQTIAKTATVKRVAKVRIVAPEWLMRKVTDADGNEYQLLKVDEAEVLRALKAGCQVSGKASIVAAELYYEESVAAVGRRK